MARQSKTPKGQKFMFDLHCFDDNHVEEPEIVIPPPPTFSEEELATARAEAYAQGKKDGLEEARIAREKFIADQLQKIAKDMATLFAAESERESMFESESVRLARAAFARIFPALNERHGLEEVNKVIAGTIEACRNLPEIVIEVCPDYVEAVQQHIAQAATPLSATGITRVAGNNALSAGDCRLSWLDGGCVRTSAAIYAKIDVIFDEALADRGTVRDNDVREPEEKPPEKPAPARPRAQKRRREDTP